MLSGGGKFQQWQRENAAKQEARARAAEARREQTQRTMEQASALIKQRVVQVRHPSRIDRSWYRIVYLSTCSQYL